MFINVFFIKKKKKGLIWHKHKNCFVFCALRYLLISTKKKSHYKGRCEILRVIRELYKSNVQRTMTEVTFTNQIERDMRCPFLSIEEEIFMGPWSSWTWNVFKLKTSNLFFNGKIQIQDQILLCKDYYIVGGGYFTCQKIQV